MGEAEGVNIYDREATFHLTRFLPDLIVSPILKETLMWKQCIGQIHTPALD